MIIKYITNVMALKAPASSIIQEASFNFVPKHFNRFKGVRSEKNNTYTCIYSFNRVFTISIIVDICLNKQVRVVQSARESQ